MSNTTALPKVTIALTLMAVIAFATGVIGPLATAIITTLAVALMVAILIKRLPFLNKTRRSLRGPLMTIGIGAVAGGIVYFLYPH